MEVQGSYMTCSNPAALRGRAGTITCSTESQSDGLSVYYHDVLVQRQKVETSVGTLHWHETFISGSSPSCSGRVYNKKEIRNLLNFSYDNRAIHILKPSWSKLQN